MLISTREPVLAPQAFRHMHLSSTCTNSIKNCVVDHSMLSTCDHTIDGFQMSIKRPTSGGQACAQEAAVEQSFHLERSSFFYL